jgi:hypothetical protein
MMNTLQKGLAVRNMTVPYSDGTVVRATTVENGTLRNDYLILKAPLGPPGGELIKETNVTLFPAIGVLPASAPFATDAAVEFFYTAEKFITPLREVGVSLDKDSVTYKFDKLTGGDKSVIIIKQLQSVGEDYIDNGDSTNDGTITSQYGDIDYPPSWGPPGTTAVAPEYPNYPAIEYVNAGINYSGVGWGGAIFFNHYYIPDPSQHHIGVNSDNDETTGWCDCTATNTLDNNLYWYDEDYNYTFLRSRTGYSDYILTHYIMQGVVSPAWCTMEKNATVSGFYSEVMGGVYDRVSTKYIAICEDVDYTGSYSYYDDAYELSSWSVYGWTYADLEIPFPDSGIPIIVRAITDEGEFDVYTSSTPDTNYALSTLVVQVSEDKFAYLYSVFSFGLAKMYYGMIFQGQHYRIVFDLFDLSYPVAHYFNSATVIFPDNSERTVSFPSSFVGKIGRGYIRAGKYLRDMKIRR